MGPQLSGVFYTVLPNSPNKSVQCALLSLFLRPHLDAVLEVVGDLDGVVVLEAGEALGHHAVRHRPRRGHVAPLGAGNLI